MWSLDQQHWHHVGACKTTDSQAPLQGDLMGMYISQDPGSLHAHFRLGEPWSETGSLHSLIVKRTNAQGMHGPLRSCAHGSQGDTHIMYIRRSKVGGAWVRTIY